MKKKTFLTDLSELFRRLTFTVPVILVAMFGYGYTFTQLSLSTDDMTAERYTLGNELLSQGRYTAVLFKRFLGLFRNVPHFGDMLCVLLLIVSAYVFGVVLMRASRYKLKDSSLTVFACLLISYSYMNEIYVYNGGNINVTLGFLLTSFALYFTAEYFTKKQFPMLIYSGLILIAIASLYESFIVVYILGCISILILRFYYSDEHDRGKFGKVLLRGIIMLAPAAAAIVLEFLLGKVVNSIFDFGDTGYMSAQTLWGNGIAYVLENAIKQILYYHVIAAKYYLPARELLIGVNLVFVFAIVTGIKRKNITISLLCLAGIVSLTLLNIAKGCIASPRMAQYYTYFIAFFVMLLYQFLLENIVKIKKEKVGKALTAVVCFCAFLLVFYQTYDLNAWLCLDVQRYEYEKELVTDACEELYKNYDIENKPVIFCGSPTFSESITSQIFLYSDDSAVQKTADIIEKLGFEELAEDIRTIEGAGKIQFVQNNLTSYIAWGEMAFGEPNTEILKFCHFLGYDKIFSVDDFDTVYMATSIGATMTDYPMKGSIVDDGDYIFVHF